LTVYITQAFKTARHSKPSALNHVDKSPQELFATDFRHKTRMGMAVLD
jgi:hypothetical protein